MAGNIVPFVRHARTSTAAGADSTGYKSGRSSCLDTPDTRSTASTRNGGTSSHCEIACGVMPSGSASLSKPPAALIARLRASFRSVMTADESIALHKNQVSLHCANQAALYAIEMSLGSRLKTARKKAKLTQSEVGRHFSISSQAVSQWERDEVTPEFDKLGQLCRILKIPADWLLAGDGPPPDQDEVAALLDRLDRASRRQALRILRSLVDDSDQAA